MRTRGEWRANGRGSPDARPETDSNHAQDQEDQQIDQRDQPDEMTAHPVETIEIEQFACEG